jgi:integrase
MYMAVIEKRVSRKGTISYRAKIRLKGFPPINETFKRKTDADRWAQSKEAAMLEGRYFPEAKAKKNTINDMIEAYLNDLGVKNPRRAKEVKKLLKWWKAKFGHVTLADFKSEHVMQAQSLLRDRDTIRKDENGKPIKMSGATINRYTVALSTAFNFGIKRLKWISHNPVADVDKFKEPLNHIRFLSEQEIIDLLSACKRSQNPHLFNLVMIGIATGARRNEIARMKWEDVNEDGTRITLPKTKNGEVRSVFVEGRASELLKKMRSEKLEGQLLLFPSPNDPNRPIDFRHAWEHALKTAKIKGVRFHDLRHSTASHLAMNGANAVEIAEVLGHKTLAMVKRYTHLSNSHTSKVVATMAERILGHVEI